MPFGPPEFIPPFIPVTGMKCSYGKISSPLTEISVGKTEISGTESARPLRESSFNMTREGDEEDIETRSLKFEQPPSLAVQFFRSPLLGSRKNFRAPRPLLLQFLCSPEKRSLDCIKYIYHYCLQWFIL